MKIALLTIDVERDLGVSLFASSEEKFKGVKNIPSLLFPLLDDLNIPVTFFVTTDVLLDGFESEEYDKHELAVHASTQWRFPHELVLPFKIFESEYGINPHGFRAGGFMATQESINLLNEMNILYDSSLYSKIINTPYHPSQEQYLSQGDMKIWELPLSSSKKKLFSLSGTWFRYFGNNITQFLLPVDLSYLNICLHSWDFTRSKKYGFRGGKSFVLLLKNLLSFLQKKDYVFMTCTNYVETLNEIGENDG